MITSALVVKNLTIQCCTHPDYITINVKLALSDNDRLFPEKNTVKDHISNTKLEKGDHYYIQTRHKDLFSHYNLILRKLSEKMSRKALENTNEMCSCPLGIL